MRRTRILQLTASLGFLLLSTGHGQASHEVFGVYEDWSTAHTIRSERWGGAVDSAQEIHRAVNRLGRALVMRLRKEGSTSSNVGFTSAFHRLSFANPTSVDQIEADFRVRELTVTGCALNTSFPSRVRPVQLSLNKFNDGSSTGPGDSTGDHFGRIQVNRDGDSADPPDVMRVQAFVFRCVDRTCSNAVSLGPGVFFPDLVSVGEVFTLRLIWDSPNNQFRAGVGAGPDVSLPYPASANVRPPGGVAFADIRINGIPAHCIEGPTVADSTIAVREVRTNLSAIVP